MIDINYYKTVAETQNDSEILKAELLDFIKEVEESIPIEPPVKPEIADNKDLIIFMTFIAERLRLKDDDFINGFTKYGIVDYIINKIKNNDIP